MCRQCFLVTTSEIVVIWSVPIAGTSVKGFCLGEGRSAVIAALRPTLF